MRKMLQSRPLHLRNHKCLSCRARQRLRRNQCRRCLAAAVLIRRRPCRRCQEVLGLLAGRVQTRGRVVC